ncbi:MAG: DNA primase [Candidatus Doudnabacteria bacterium]
MADNNTIQEIKDRLDVVEVISGYLPVKKSGSNFRAVCPFHNEKTPSLMISPSKQIWHCFGCGEGGDVIGFVMKYENYDFPQTLRHTAEMAGVKLPEFKPKDPQKEQLTEQLFRINRFAVSVYQKNLTSSTSKLANEYLQNRGLSSQTILKWQIGFAPDSFDFLYKFLVAKNVQQDLAVQAGVLAKSDKGKIFDRFRNRVMFPILNLTGQPVGFSARVMPGQDQNTAKYINSPETLIYNKSKELFGLYFAKDAIRQSKQVVVVEGQLDCIQAEQAGFANTVATSGTALTEQQFRILKRFAETIILAFDSDSAGQKAAYRATLLGLSLGCQIKLASYQADQDPDQIIKQSPKQWHKILDQSMLPVDFYINFAQQNYDFGSLEQTQYVSTQILPLLKLITSPLEQDHYLKKLVEKFSLSELALKQELSKLSNQVGVPILQAKSKKQSESGVLQKNFAQSLTWEKEVFGGLAIYSEFREFVSTEGLPEIYLSDLARPWFALVLTGKGVKKSQDLFVQESIFMVESNLENLQNNELALLRELKKSFYLFKLSGLKNYLQDLTVEIKKAELEKNDQVKEQLSAKFATASKLRFEIETKLQEA